MTRLKYTQSMIDNLIAAGGLAGNDFHKADLRGIDLSNADLREADLSNADLRKSDLREADLHRADLSLAKLEGINWGIDPDTIRVENLCAKILASIDSGGTTLDMARWHCGTAHCLAGHAVVLAPGGA